MITIDNFPQFLFDATLLFLFWLIFRVMLLLIEPLPKPKPDKITEILRILSK